MHKRILGFALFRRSSLAALALATLGSSTVLAQDEGVEFHGFLTAGFTIGDDEQTYLRSTTDEISFSEDSVFGLQVIAPINDKLTVQGQLLANGSRVDDAEFDVKLDWAFASYEVNDNLTVRAGRIRFPILLASEYVEAGYAYPWIRPPQEVYSDVPVNAVDGMDLLISGPQLGSFDLTVQPYYGSLRETFFLGPLGSADTESTLFGLNLSLSNSYITARVGGFNSDLEIPAIGVELDIDYYSAGISAELGNFLVMAELAEVEVTEVFGLTGSESWYAMLGYRIGDWMPHLTIADGNSTNSSEYLTAGLRYELTDSSALKFEYSNIEPGLFQEGDFAGPLSDGPDANVLSVALDVVF